MIRISDELAVIFFVYNPGLTAQGKPDISIEYRFDKRGAGGETYFSKTAPQLQNNLKSTFIEGLRSFDWERTAQGLSADFRGRFPRPAEGRAVDDDLVLP